MTKAQLALAQGMQLAINWRKLLCHSSVRHDVTQQILFILVTSIKPEEQT